jgi:hypothetical protein
MKKLTTFFALSIFVLSLSSCSKTDSATGASITTFTATLNGANESTPNSSTATGTALLKFNNTTKTFTITTLHTLAAAATNGHIHLGAVGLSGPPVFGFVSFTSPIDYTSVALTAAQEADLMANLYYVNLHTAAFGSGEIRGQLIKGATTTDNGGIRY